ncbi:MAG: GNAT family N-acetyltransferase, partial [Vicinamibacteria bacterium]|nr:GNAT family N-acetyltransferase [Vicinamibacteria bacterium]
MIWRSLKVIRASEIEPLLNEEREHWRDSLRWDFSITSQAILQALEHHTLGGCLAQDGSRPLGYCYFMAEAGRALIGTVFAGKAARSRDLEAALLEIALAEAKADNAHRRIECQTLFATARQVEDCFQKAGFQGCERHYLTRPLSEPAAIPCHAYRLRSIRRAELSALAQIIFASHMGSLDAAFNQTYSSFERCVTFVENLILRDACGVFNTEASCVVENAHGVVGVLIASHVSRTNGHICQISVRPEEQGRGIGTALIAAALWAMRQQGLEWASLSVTVGNASAYDLYRRL